MKFIEVKTEYKPQEALEGIVDIVDKSFTSMVSSISTFLPAISSMLALPLEKMSNVKEIPSAVIQSLSGAFNSGKISENDFRVFTNVVVSVPESFSGNMYEYSEYLKRSWSFLDTRLVPQIDVFYAFLATFASNKEAKISLTDSAKVYKSLEQEHNVLKKEGETYFGTDKHNKSSSTLGSTFTDLNQALLSYNTSHKLCKDLSPKEAKLICDKINKITNVLNVIIEDAKDNKIDKASFESVKSLAVGVYALAEAIEFYAVTYYRTMELAVVMGKNKKVIDNLK